MSLVLKPWVEKLPWKMQSALLSSFRGTDTGNYPSIKSVTRWMRMTCEHNADPDSRYMKDVKNILNLPIHYMCKELEWCTVHYAEHFMKGLQIIAYRHPDSYSRILAYDCYSSIATEIFHLHVETESEMNSRLGPG